MKLKMNKDEFLWQVKENVKDAVARSFVVNATDYYGQPVSVNFNELISKAVASGVMSAMETLIESQYTNEDFEHDMGLDNGSQ